MNRNNPTPASSAETRVFLFLQGPHGPFFHSLGRMLRKTGAAVWRVGFNAGDRAFWFDRRSYIPYFGRPEDWPATFQKLLDQLGVTDVILYGDTRPVHATAVEIARNRGLQIHVFEEGYLRPWWITYERGGSNGNSRLMSMDIDDMRKALTHSDAEAPPPPAHWGDMREHIFYGAVYHWFVMFANRKYRNFRPHRALTVAQEFRQHFRRLLLMPAHRLERIWATARLHRSGAPYHLVLMQLAHDSSVQSHSDFDCASGFLDQVFRGFAKGAPRHHHLVIKEHPLESQGTALRREARRLARLHGICDRTHYIPGGKLAALLDDARSAVTINSTAGQQALWRGIPLRVFGRSVYDKPEIVSTQPIDQFFDRPQRPDGAAYRAYRRYLLETSQIPGGYYSHRGRRQLLRRVADKILSQKDPYEALEAGQSLPKPQLRVVK
ncbi:capsule biosynthesis protein CapA [Ruegeria marisrubri]|uniref:Capsule biosynthesis protein CapA n=1 Tax=Ruegeria marisrubri TaxID=1685379 RepID=A0A0X3TZV5_9RHOB|nr:capsule biosynthesis protein CapA [Ruegeria marisrubri]KUJ80581.1 capsule biosynthesis protein CapA [Ruegeria marisrubri]